MPCAQPAGRLHLGCWFTSIFPGANVVSQVSFTISCPPHRKLSTLNAWMMDNSYNTTKLWEDIEDIIIKTLISAHPVVKHNYQSCFPNHTTGCACFEILGFDILLDRKLKPWLLEVRKGSPAVLKQLWKQQIAERWLLWGRLQNKGGGVNRTRLVKKGHLVCKINQAIKTSSQTTCCRLGSLSSQDPRARSLYTLS